MSELALSKLAVPAALLLSTFLSSCHTAAPATAHAQSLAGQSLQTSAGSPVQAGALRMWSGALRMWSGGSNTETLISQPNAMWDKLGLTQARQTLVAAQGEGVTVAVIDTGLDLKHPVFAGRLAPAAAWRDFVDGDRLPQEQKGAAYGHGTAVASVVLQIAPKVRILPLRVLGGDGSGDETALAAAIDHATAQGVEVINLSLGTPDRSMVVDAAVARATQAGVYMVSSAGNTDAEPTFPAQDSARPGHAGDLSVGVGSVSLNGEKSWFSNFLPDDHSAGELELVSFGEQVRTALPDNMEGAWDGTSFAAPMVSAALALAIAEGAEATYPGQLVKLVLEHSLDTEVEGSSNGQSYELEQRLHIGQFLNAVLADAEQEDDD